MNASVRQPVYEFEGFRLDAQRRLLLRGDGQTIQLTPRLIDLLLYLVERPSRLLPKEELLEAIWPHVIVEEHNLNKAISELRRVLGEKAGEHRFIVTKPGRGYRFVADVSIAVPNESETLPEVAQDRGEPEVATPSEPAVAEPASRGRSRNLWLLGSIGAAALLAGGLGFSVFDASAPRPGLRFTPLAFEKNGGEIPHVIGSTVWKPDSTAIAFSVFQRDAPGPPQPHVLRFDGSFPVPIAPGSAGGLPKAWTRTGHVLLNRSLGPTAISESAGLWTVPVVGGEPEPLFTVPAGTINVQSLSTDGSTLAALRRDEQGTWGIWVGTIASGTLERYEPVPVAPTTFMNLPALAFSPDGRQLLLMWNPSAEGEQAWLLPYPPDPANPPRRILAALPSHGGTPQFSWLPDNRHIVVSVADRGKPWRPYLADTLSDRFRPLTDGTSTAHLLGPTVSPDGTRLILSEDSSNLDIVTMDVHTAKVSPLLATERDEETPAWAAAGKHFVYVTNRNGEAEIWLGDENGAGRALVTARQFPPDTTTFLMAPELSPDGTRVMYLRVESDARGGNGAHLWMSSLDGGEPMRLRNGAALETPGSWSPDSAWYVYEELQADGSRTLKKARTSSTAEPETLASGVVAEGVPIWSPDGRWILFDDNGLKLIGEDGGTRDLGVKGAVCTFARTPDLLYCIEDLSAERTGEVGLVTRSFDGTATVVGTLEPEHWPAVSGSPSLRLSLTPDGEGVSYSVRPPHVELLLGEGLADVPRP